MHALVKACFESIKISPWSIGASVHHNTGYSLLHMLRQTARFIWVQLKPLALHNSSHPSAQSAKLSTQCSRARKHQIIGIACIASTENPSQPLQTQIKFESTQVSQGGRCRRSLRQMGRTQAFSAQPTEATIITQPCTTISAVRCVHKVAKLRATPSG